MPIRPGPPNNPLKIKPYSTFLRPVPVPGMAHDEGDLTCVRFNETWRSYILGALEILRWQDVWEGSGIEIEATLDQVEALYAAIAEGSCTDVTAIYDVRADGCILEVQRTEGGEWEELSDFTGCADGGTPGPPGPTGPVGPPGDPCDCEVCSGVYSGAGPTETVELVDVANACGFAAGMADWLHGEYEASLLLANQLFQAGSTIASIAIGLVEAIPLLGGVASAILTFAEFAETITFELLEYAESDEWHDWILCECYCYFLAHPAIDLEAMEEFLAWLTNKAFLLPPQGPLLVVVGQPFAGLLAGAHPPDVLKRANFYALEESIDCIDCECPFDWMVEFFEGDGLGDWTIEEHFLPGPDVGCQPVHDQVNDLIEGCTPMANAQVGAAVTIELPADTEVTSIYARVAWNRTRPYLTDNIIGITTEDVEGDPIFNRLYKRGGAGEYIEAFTWEGNISSPGGGGLLRVGGATRNNNDSDGSYWRLERLIVAGFGTSPFE